VFAVDFGWAAEVVPVCGLLLSTMVESEIELTELERELRELAAPKKLPAAVPRPFRPLCNGMVGSFVADIAGEYTAPMLLPAEDELFRNATKRPPANMTTIRTIPIVRLLRSMHCSNAIDLMRFCPNVRTKVFIIRYCF
jgi:hypothetical protein